MSALDPSAAVTARAHVDIELTYQRSDDGQVLLILRRCADGVDRSATGGARVRQGRGVSLVDVAGTWAVPALPIGRAGPAPWSSTMPLRMGLRKRRGLAEASPACGVQLFLDLLVAPLPPIAVTRYLASLAFKSRQVFTQPRDLLVLPIDQVVALVARLAGHASVMTYPRKLYKYGFLDRGCRQEITSGQTR
jgi:hypothetical protein